MFSRGKNRLTIDDLALIRSGHKKGKIVRITDTNDDLCYVIEAHKENARPFWISRRKLVRASVYEILSWLLA